MARIVALTSADPALANGCRIRLDIFGGEGVGDTNR